MQHKYDANNMFGNENSKSENKSSKSGISSSISENDKKADGADIRPTYDTDSLEHVDNDDYNVFTMEKEHPEQPEYVNDTYLVEQGDTNTTVDSSDMSNNGREVDQDDDLAKERELLDSLIKQMKIEIDGSKQNNKSLESSNKALREAITFLTNELKRYKEIDFVKNVELKSKKSYGLLEEQKVTSEKPFRAYTEKVINLNKKLSEMENELSTHQRTISIISFQNRNRKVFQISSASALQELRRSSSIFTSVYVAVQKLKKTLAILRVDVELKDNIFVAMPRIKGDGYYTCNIRVEYEWKPPRCACCKVFEHVHEECPKNIGAGATKTLKKTSQTPKGIPVRRKMGFKPKQVFQTVSKKSTANTRSKMNNPESTKEVSKSNPFEVLTSVDNDVDFGKLRFVDDDGNPLVPTGIVESDSEVEMVFDETANLRISTSGKDGSDKG
ncbi:hypothetical protein Tco_0167831 [Tanacetum coccineum]